MMLGQSAIEYLTTYGWMLVVVAVAGGTIYTQLPSNCDLDTNQMEVGDVQITDIGVNSNGELVLALRGKSSEDIILQEIEILGDESVSNNTAKELGLDSTSVQVEKANEQSTCKEFDLQVTYDKGSLNNLQEETTLKLPLELVNVVAEILKVSGGTFPEIESTSSIKATATDICIGGSCTESESSSDERVNRSGDTINGAIKTNGIEFECLGGNCPETEGDYTGYLTESQNTVDGTLKVTEIKPNTNLCIGRSSC